MRFKSYSLIFLFVFSTLAVRAQTSSTSAVEQFVGTAGLEHASIGFCVKDMSGKVIANHNMDKAYTPASILKIVTTATALEALGADFRYVTTLQRGANNTLIISGVGDPTLGTEHLNNNQTVFVEEWSDEVIQAFDQAEPLNILVRDDYFGYQGVSRKWIYEDIGNYFAAPSYGISVFDNTYRVIFNTEDKKKGAQLIKTIPTVSIKFTNTLSLNSTGQDNGYILGTPFTYERTIIGDIPANRKSFTIKGSIPDPGLYLGETIADALRLKRFDVRKVETTRNTYLSEIYSEERTDYIGEVFHEHLSPTLTDIIRNVNEKSNNHYAEHLIRTIGRVKNPNAYSLPLEEGVEKTKEVWQERGLNTDALFIYDGSGLAPSNAVSAELMCDILVYMQKSENALPFFNSLPKAGKAGTVRNLLKGTRLDGKLSVKSGSIANVQCYAGYYTDGGTKYAFTIMVNNYHSSRRQVVRAIEKLLLGIF